MSTIPLSKKFKIRPTVISPAGNAVDANGLIITTSTLIPTGRVASIYSAQDAADTFGYQSTEYEFASIYFNGYQNSSASPAELLFYRDVTASANAGIFSGKMSFSDLATLKTITSGELNISVDGVVKTFGNIDLSSATSFSGVASAISDSMPEWTIAFNDTVSKFYFQINDSSAKSVAVSLASTASSLLKIDADSGGVNSPQASPTSVSEMMNSIVDQNQNWIGVCATTDYADSKKLEFCQWVNSQNYRYFYVLTDSSSAATLPNNPDCQFQKLVVANNLENVFPIYGSAKYGVLPLTYAASINFDRAGGRVSFDFRSFTGVAPTVDTLSVAQALESNGYNYYGRFGLNKTLKTFATTGAISGKFLWLDTFVSQVWINANLVSAFTNLFTSDQSFSFRSSGYSAISAPVIDVATRAVNFGAIVPGVELDESQVSEINRVAGADITQTLFSAGWYFLIPPQSGANRIERALKGVVFFYCDGQLIQTIDMASTNIL